MLEITATDAWREAHVGAAIGLLEMSGVVNVDESSRLDQRKRALESRLRETYSGFDRADFLAIPILDAYKRYYKRFKKTYHVQLQIESIVLRGKSLPSVSPLVDANFLAEMDDLVLTAGHDASKLHEPIVIDVSVDGDQMTLMRGTPKTIRAGDMVMRDSTGISCSIIYGQDNRSPISAGTTHVLYVSYAPPGVPLGSVKSTLANIEEHVREFAPSAVLEQSRLITTE
jgi:DNA/RNA-binding domain of Phe-tRNA-synthetase-like protein